MMRLTIKTPPTVLAVDPALVRDHLRIEIGPEDYLVENYIRAATALLDGWTGILGRALMEQTWVMTLASFPAGGITIPLGPVTAIDAVRYRDASGTWQTVAPADYEVSLGEVSAELRAAAGWPGTGDWLDAVEVEFTAGGECPAPVQTAIMIMVAAIFDGRQGDDMLTPAAAALTAPFRVRRV